jgi:hypothetical protein
MSAEVATLLRFTREDLRDLAMCAPLSCLFVFQLAAIIAMGLVAAEVVFRSGLHRKNSGFQGSPDSGRNRESVRVRFARCSAIFQLPDECAERIVCRVRLEIFHHPHIVALIPVNDRQVPAVGRGKALASITADAFSQRRLVSLKVHIEEFVSPVPLSGYKQSLLICRPHQRVQGSRGLRRKPAYELAVHRSNFNRAVRTSRDRKAGTIWRNEASRVFQYSKLPIKVKAH